MATKVSPYVPVREGLDEFAARYETLHNDLVKAIKEGPADNLQNDVLQRLDAMRRIVANTLEGVKGDLPR